MITPKSRLSFSSPGTTAGPCFPSSKSPLRLERSSSACLVVLEWQARQFFSSRGCICSRNSLVPISDLDSASPAGCSVGRCAHTDPGSRTAPQSVRSETFQYPDGERIANLNSFMDYKIGIHLKDREAVPLCQCLDHPGQLVTDTCFRMSSGPCPCLCLIFRRL